MGEIIIRPATAADIPVMQDIEITAGRRFLDVGMPEIARAEPMPDERLRDYVDGGRAWVAAASDRARRAVAYILADVVDRAAHVEQVSVLPEFAGQRIGSQLIDAAAAWAAAHGLPALTLTTFREVPWNAPYYERLGFRHLDGDELGDGLRALMAMEADHGLEPATRVAMRRPVTLPSMGANDRCPECDAPIPDEDIHPQTRVDRASCRSCGLQLVRRDGEEWAEIRG